MANNSEQFNASGSSEFTDDAIRRFLLAQLHDAERLLFEVRLFGDDSLEMRVRLAEYELTDDYAFKRLHPADRKLFEQKFLLSIDRKRKLKVSNTLRNRFASVSAALPFGEKATVGERLRSFLGITQPRRLAFGVFILLLLLGGVWLAIKAPHLREKFIARRLPVVRPSPSTSLRASHHASPTLNHHETSSQVPPNEQPDSPATADPAVSVVLSPASSFESRQSPLISLPNAEQDIVRLTLPVRSNQPATLRAVLLTSDGQCVFSGHLLKADDTDGSQAYLDVSAGLLKTGEYQVKLSHNDGSWEPLGNYYFRVR